MAKIRQTPLTRAARGQECTVQLYPYCIGTVDTSTTVLAHAPCEDKGMSRKGPDWWAADTCDACHSILDGRKQVPDITREEIYRCFVRGIYRTLRRRIMEQELIKVKGVNL